MPFSRLCMNCLWQHVFNTTRMVRDPMSGLLHLVHIIVLILFIYLLKHDRHLPFFIYALSYEDIININGTENSHADDMHDIILMIIYQIFTITRNEGQDVRHRDQKVVCVGESLMSILCLEDSVISIISPSSGGSPGPV